MRIIIASDLHWPTINGIATFGRSLAHALAAQGHDVLVIAPSQTGKRYNEVDGNHTIIRTQSVPFPFYQNFRISVNPYPEVKRAVMSFKPDIIHVQTPLGIGLAMLKAARKFNIPVVATNHVMPENLIKNLRLIKPIAKSFNFAMREYGARYFYVNVDYLTVPTKTVMNMYKNEIEQLRAKVPVEAVSNGIDLSSFKPGVFDVRLAKKFGFATDRPIVLYVGRLDAEKHIHILIKAMSRLLKKIDAHLLIVGSGVDGESLQQLAAELGIAPHVTFTGRVSDEDKRQLYRAATVLAMPSPAELQSIVMLEGLATGLPAVAVDAGPLRELCQDGRNGYLYKMDDAAGMARRLGTILNQPELCKKMGRESLAIAKTHDLRHTVERFLHIYSETIHMHGARPKRSMGRQIIARFFS